MSRILAWILGFAIAASLCAEKRNWSVEPWDDRPHWVSIYPSVEGFSTLAEALAAVDDEQEIRSLRISEQALGQEMQEDLFSYFEAKHPDKLKTALASSGNLHNPALRPLSGVFEEAVLSTSYVEEVGKLLQRSKHRVRGISYEKFFIATLDEGPLVHAILWLRIERCTEPERAPSPPTQ